MKLIHIPLGLAFSLAFLSIHAQTLDLSTLHFGQSAQGYHLEQLKTSRTVQQKGHYLFSWEAKQLALKDNGERVSTYVFLDAVHTSQLNYHGLKVDSLFQGAVLSTYNQQIAYLEVRIDASQTPQLIHYLLEQEGKPSQIFTDSEFDSAIHAVLKNEIKKTFPKIFTEDSNDGLPKFTYPKYLLWEKGDVLYRLNIISGYPGIENTLTIVTKKALQDRVIYKLTALDDDDILSKYVK